MTPLIPHLPDGYWWVVGLTMAFSLASFDTDSGGESFLGRMVNRIAMYVLCLPIMFAVLSFFAGLGILAYKMYLWLRHGSWLGFSLGDALWSCTPSTSRPT
jgi:hypothetical protein